MENIVFRKFIDDEIIQKTVIFADIFNLNIDNWRPANTKEHPYRIIFYNSGIIVGYIDAEVYEVAGYKSIMTDMPFVLFTPFGKITGHFSTYGKYFSYILENRINSFKRIDGLFQVKKSSNKPSEKSSERYRISSTLTLKDLKSNLVRVSFEDFSGNFGLNITKGNLEGQETARLFFSENCLLIEHINYLVSNRKQEFAKVKIELESDSNFFPASFEFLGNVPYQKNIEIDGGTSGFRPYWEKLGLIDFSAVKEDLAENDPRMFAFIDEVRSDLTFLANGITPVSLYDKIARSCLYKKSDRFRLSFTGAQSTNTTLEHNLVLKKMDQKRQEKRFH